MVFRDTCIVLIGIRDDGEGIFKKLTRLCNLPDERQALIELSKGKLTTDPDNHSGEGIFFTFRAFDVFMIDSKELQFSHNNNFKYNFFDESEMPLDVAGTSDYD